MRTPTDKRFILSLPRRRPENHKGQNGIVLVIGGNELYHGAPLLTALGAEKSGVDLIYVLAPENQLLPLKNGSANFIVQPFHEKHFTAKDFILVDSCPHSPEVIVIGNGLGKHPDTQKTLLLFLKKIKTPLVLDGDALTPKILRIAHDVPWIITPHGGEFHRLFGVADTSENIGKMAKRYNLVILKKGPVDFIADTKGLVQENTTGVPQMSVGGTGDTLAGLVAGFIAQKMPPEKACLSAAFLWGKCGEKLQKKMFSFTAKDLLAVFPYVAKACV